MVVRGARRLLLAYMDQLQQILLIRSNDNHALEKFADLVRITVVNLSFRRMEKTQSLGMELFIA